MSKKDELLKLFINYCIVAFLGIFSYVFVNFDEMNFLKIMLSSVGLLACVTSLILLSKNIHKGVKMGAYIFGLVCIAVLFGTFLFIAKSTKTARNA